MTESWIIYHEDNLVRKFRRYKGLDTQYSYHGKRVSKNCPLTREEIRTYIEKGTIRAIKLIKESRNIGLKEAKNLFDEVRGPINRTHRKSRR